MDVLVRIKRLIIQRKVIFTEKAELEMQSEQLTPELILESILNAPAINKTIRSTNPKTGKRELLHIIKGLTYNGILIYTKGKIVKHKNEEVFYVLISSKRSTD